MKYRYRKLTEEEIDAALADWNTYAAEWTRRELDLDGPLPDSADPWSEIITVCNLSKKANYLLFYRKDKPDETIELRLRKNTPIFGEGMSCIHPQIERCNVLSGKVSLP